MDSLSRVLYKYNRRLQGLQRKGLKLYQWPFIVSVCVCVSLQLPCVKTNLLKEQNDKQS